MAELTRWALSQRLLIILLTLLLIVAGYFAQHSLPVDAFPDISPTQVKIIIKAPGMTPQEVESRITAPLEVELLGIPKQKMLRSIAKYALMDITLDFEEGTDIYWARQQVAERLNTVWGDLPDGIDGGIAPLTTPLGEMFMFTVESDTLSLMQRRNALDWIIRPALRTVPGVADVNALGGLVRSFEVIPDYAALSARNITLQDIITALENNNRNDGAGRIDRGEETLLVRAEGRIQTLDDIRNIIVANVNGIPVSMADVAKLRIGALSRYGALSKNGQAEAVEGLVLSLRGANARQLVVDLQDKLDELKPALPEGLNVKVFYSRGDLVNRALYTVVEALLIAVILVLGLLLVFLGNIRASITVAFILPLSALSTFLLMQQFELSANLMSLGGLAIAIGMLVDSAVVVVENIQTQLAESAGKQKLPQLHIIYRAVSEIGVPITSGIIIIIIVFLPLLTLEGLEGKLFSPVAFTIVFALAAALLLSLTVIPVIASFLIKQVDEQQPWLIRQLLHLYQPILRWCLDNSRTVILLSVFLFIIAMFIFTRIGSTFLPTMDEGDIVVQTEKLPSITLQQSVALDLAVQKAILDQIPEVIDIISRTGSDEIGLDPMSLNETDNFLVLKPRDQWQVSDKQELLDKIRAVLDQLPGVAYSFTQPIEMRVGEMLTGSRGDVAIKIFGPELGMLNQLASTVADVVSGMQGATDVFTRENEGMQYQRVVIDRYHAGRLGIDVDAIETLLHSRYAGLTLGIVQEGIQRTPLILRGDINQTALSEIKISTETGANITLDQIVHLEEVEGVVSIKRERGQRFSVVQTNVSGRDLVGFVDQAKQRVTDQVNLPRGYYMTWGGQFENQQRAAARLTIVVPVSIGLIFLLLNATFGSSRQAILILTNVPLAMIGGIVGLWLSGEYLSVSASVGFIALLGIAVLNGVVMVTHFNQLRVTGMRIEDVVIQGSMRRLRPVLMTATMAIAGLIPLLFATGPGSEIQKPLAVVVVGGLVTSTMLTLVVLPILYRRFGVTPS
ncbi:MAG TPA: efflux RND transporter permease subunit [Crenotrichaceae bacterium]|nr:efflux RND transporter permease subunit [Crenotrichaceae bacterium]